MHKRSWCSGRAAAAQLIINGAPPREQKGRLESSQQEVSPSVWSLESGAPVSRRADYYPPGFLQVWELLRTRKKKT